MDLSGTSVLVTGGAGFIGCNLVRRLIDLGAREVRVLDDFSTGYRDNLRHLDVAVHEGSILDETAVSTAVRGVDAVVHLAALGSVPRSIENPLASFEVNAVGTQRVLEACRALDVSHVITVSSSSVYGSNPSLPRTETDWVAPLSPYAASKLAGEGLSMSYATCYDLGVLAFRFFNVFGPYQAADHPYAAVIPRFLKAATSDQPLSIHGDGLQSRDFTYVETVVDVLVDAIDRGVTCTSPVNLAFGTTTTLLDLVGALERVTGRSLERTFVPARPGDVRFSSADGRLLRELFPAIEPTRLENGLASTIEWFTR